MKDYARFTPPTRKGKSRHSWVGGTILLIGIAIAIPLGFYVIKLYRMHHLNTTHVLQHLHALQKNHLKEVKSHGLAANSSQSTEFEFYTLLPKMEVVVQTAANNPPTNNAQMTSKPTQENNLENIPTNDNPDHEIDPSTTQTPVPHPKYLTSVASSPYYLQVASLQSIEIAKTLKAKISNLGLVATIQTIKTPEGTSWNRVIIGPYKNLSDARAAQATLSASQMNSLLLKAK